MAESTLEIVIHRELLTDPDHFEFITCQLANLHIGVHLVFRRYADPVHGTLWKFDGPIGFDGQIVSHRLENLGEGREVLQGRLTSRENDSVALPRMHFANDVTQGHVVPLVEFGVTPRAS